jgi:hypothetical protein
MELESKFEGVPMSWTLIKIYWKFSRTLEFDEIWLAWSFLHLIARKNKFPLKGDQKFEFLAGGNLDWFHNDLKSRLHFQIPLLGLGLY